MLAEYLVYIGLGFSCGRHRRNRSGRRNGVSHHLVKAVEYIFVGKLLVLKSYPIAIVGDNTMGLVKYIQYIVFLQSNAFKHIEGIRGIILEYSAGEQKMYIGDNKRTMHGSQHILLMLCNNIAYDIFTIDYLILSDDDIFFHYLKSEWYGQLKGVAVHQSVCIAFYYSRSHVFPSVSIKIHYIYYHCITKFRHNQ